MATEKRRNRRVRPADYHRVLFAQAGDGIFVTDDRGFYVDVNASGHLLLGCQPGELEGRRIADSLRPEDQSSMIAAFEEVRRGKVLTRDWVLVRKDGSTFDAEVTAQQLDHGLLLAIVRDVTARKAAERRLRDSEAHLKELIGRLEKIASQVPGVVYQFKLRPDGSSCFPYASERIREIFRVAPDEVRDDAAQVFAALHPDDLDGVNASIQQSAATLRPWQYEFRVAFADGTVRWLFGNSVPERQADGAVLWHGFITDVTDRKRAEEARSQLEVQLRQIQKVEGIGRLAGGVAHDFNNLLTSVLGFAELALRALPQESPARPFVARVMESGARGAALTQQLLAFARRKIVKPEAVDLNEVLRRMVPLIQRLVGEHFELVAQEWPRPCVTRVDVGSFEQVVMNLVVNARDAMPDGGRLTLATREVQLDADYVRAHPDATPGRYVMLAVGDTGTGMTPDVKARLFEPFFTTKPVGRGTGLGLAVCHGIVKQAGGHIAVASEPGRGTEVLVHLPRVRAAARRNDQGAAAGATDWGSESVLIVEDDPMILAVAREVLAGHGYRVFTAADGVEALEVVERAGRDIALLLTDVVMPRMGGRELASRLAVLRPDLRVLFVSGYTAGALGPAGEVEAGVHLLPKPYTPSQLLQRVREVLDQVAD